MVIFSVLIRDKTLLMTELTFTAQQVYNTYKILIKKKS